MPGPTRRAACRGLVATLAAPAILRPPGRAPLVAAVYLTGPAAACEAAHAEVGRLIAAALDPRGG